MSTARQENGQVAISSFAKQFGLAIAVSMVGVLIVWLVASVVSPELRVDTPSEDNQKLQWRGPSPAMIFPYGLVAAIVALALVKFQKPRSWWYIIAAIALVVAGIQVFMQTASNETAIWLNVMRVVAGAIIIPVVARFLPEG